MTSVVSLEQRFSVLYKEQQPDVLAFFLRRLVHEEAVEAAADVFVIAWRRMDDVPEGIDGRRWLFGVARNELRNHARSHRRWGRLITRVGSEPSDAPQLPETVVVRRAEEEETLNALARLKIRDREVILLRLWEEVSFDDIGAVIGCSHHAAEQRYAKALRRLRSVVGPIGHEEGKRPFDPMRREQIRET